MQKEKQNLPTELAQETGEQNRLPLTMAKCSEAKITIPSSISFLVNLP